MSSYQSDRGSSITGVRHLSSDMSVQRNDVGTNSDAPVSDAIGHQEAAAVNCFSSTLVLCLFGLYQTMLTFGLARLFCLALSLLPVF